MGQVPCLVYVLKDSEFEDPIPVDTEDDNGDSCCVSCGGLLSQDKCGKQCAQCTQRKGGGVSLQYFELYFSLP